VAPSVDDNVARCSAACGGEDMQTHQDKTSKRLRPGRRHTQIADGGDRWSAFGKHCWICTFVGTTQWRLRPYPSQRWDCIWRLHPRARSARIRNCC